MADAIDIQIKQGCLRYLDNVAPTLNDFDIHIPAGQWTCILGKSGCGKTSLLRFLANLLQEKVEWSGQLLLTGASRQRSSHPASPKSLDTAIAYMAQQDLLMPWLTVLENVCLSHQFAASSTSTVEQVQQRAQGLLEQVGLAEHAQRRPDQLSGGMRQRVALARTLMQDKPLVLMDEPFSALDAVTRHKLQNLAADLLKEKTVLLITHDPQEALRLGEQVYMMRGHPAQAVSLATPSTMIPRRLNAELAEMQQGILAQLERDYV